MKDQSKTPEFKQLMRSVRAMNVRIRDMGHRMNWSVTAQAEQRAQQWRWLVGRGRCKDCGGTCVARFYVDGSHDVGGNVLAMECES